MAKGLDCLEHWAEARFCMAFRRVTRLRGAQNNNFYPELHAVAAIECDREGGHSAEGYREAGFSPSFPFWRREVLNLYLRYQVGLLT